MLIGAVMSLAACAIMVSCESFNTVAETIKVDYERMSVPEEAGMTFTKMTDETIETLTKPTINRGSGNHLRWWANPLFAITKDGKTIAYGVYKNQHNNVFTRQLTGKGGSTQRTFRNQVQDMAFSPDGKTLCFSEYDGGNAYIYTTNAEKNSPIRRISPQNVSDYAPCYSPDGSKIFFSRKDGNSYSIWSYEPATSSMINYCYGMTPQMISDHSFLCTRTNSKGFSEIWQVDFKNGTETLVFGMDNFSFSTPSLSPNGRWIAMVGNTIPGGNISEENLDIYVVRTDGTEFTQLTYHRGHDCSPVWSPDGKYLYFVSQRGTKEGEFNIFRIDFNLK